VISKIRLPIHALAVLLCATTASAQENRGTPEQGGVRSRRLPLLRWLHSRSRESRILPETEHVRSQRRMPIGIRTKRRPFGQQSPQGTAATNSTRDVHRGRVSQQ